MNSSRYFVFLDSSFLHDNTWSCFFLRLKMFSTHSLVGIFIWWWCCHCLANVYVCIKKKARRRRRRRLALLAKPRAHLHLLAMTSRGRQPIALLPGRAPSPVPAIIHFQIREGPASPCTHTYIIPICTVFILYLNNILFYSCLFSMEILYY